MAQISLMPRTRSGGGGRTDQQYLDFIIDGKSLGDLLDVGDRCGDIGCGAITAQIEETERHFVWHSFGYENDYDLSTPKLAEYAALGPFVFDKADYKQMLKPKGKGEVTA